MKDPSVPELWKMAAFLKLCPNNIQYQVFLQIDEIKENYAVLREKVLGWVTNRVEQEISSGTAPMDIGEVHDSQSALQTHLDWPGQRQADEWDINAIEIWCRPGATSFCTAVIDIHVSVWKSANPPHFRRQRVLEV